MGDRYKRGKVADLLIGCIPEEWDWDDDGEIKSPVEWVRRQGTIYDLAFAVMSKFVSRSTSSR